MQANHSSAKASSLAGYLLTRNSLDFGSGVKVEYWLSTPTGPCRVVLDSQRPTFFVRQNDQAGLQKALGLLKDGIETKILELTTFEHEPVIAVYAKTLSLGYRVVDLLNRHNIEVLENDFRPHDRYLIERFLQGSVEISGESTSKTGFTEYVNPRLTPIDYHPDLTTLSLDIECDLQENLFSVGLACQSGPSKTAEVIMIGKPEASTTKTLWVTNETELIRKLVQRIREIDPDVICGWNLINFDLRILIQRAKQLGVPFKIGRQGRSASWRPRFNDSSRGYVSIEGRVAIDGIDALKSATWSFTSYALDYVANELLGRGKKVEGDVDDRVAEIVHNFQHDKPALAAYNLEDCQLVLDIFERTKILEYLVLRGHLTGLELDRAGGSVAAFTNLYLPRLHRAGYIAPNLPSDGGLASPGGYVMDSKPGLYKNVLVLDFKSLYPAIIRTFKVDPMGMIEGLKDTDKAIPGFRGAYFHRRRHFLPDIISKLWQERDIAKLEDDKVRSQALKIIMNSFYGVLGSGGCRFYDTRLASSITMRGHQIMQKTSQWIEQAGYEVIYGDTDSTFVLLADHLSRDECHQIGHELTSSMNQQWQQILNDDFQLDCYLELEFETHFHRFLMPTIRGSDAGSKKRYAGMTVDQQGESRLVFKGLENVRTDWTQLAKEFQATLFAMVFAEQDPTEYIANTVQQTLEGKLDDKLSYTKQLRKRLSDYTKNVPPQVRAAKIADERNQAIGKTLKYQNKGWITYLITVNGPEPVEYQESRVDHQHYVDKQLKPIADGVLPFIDLDFETIVSNQGELF